MARRKDIYYTLNTHLAYLDNAQIMALFDDDQTPTHGWGTNHTIELGQTKVFVKRVPLTDIEHAHAFSTKNLYDLPPYYNYGLGSVGFNVFRELVAHIKTTNWVLAGDIETFPLLYHYRIIPCPNPYAAVDAARHARYVTYWNDNANIGRYMLDRNQANYEVVLFLEHIPHTLVKWLGTNMDKLESFIDDMRTTLMFLRQNGIIHFDVHLGNIVTDSRRPYLTDFGLVLDSHFDLNAAERQFFSANTHYDYGELLTSISWQIGPMFDDLPEAQKVAVMDTYGIAADMRNVQRHTIMLENLEALQAAHVLPLPQNYLDTLLNYREVILIINRFFADMQLNNRKDTPYDDARLKQLLEGSGFLPEART